ncbi:hypothetical protein HPB52_019419 [Rhipicephalus sanguineus]|uniref:Uncharacterized protein n=1 Tax=Rhipicephalus sanguineus TaxID=34632 RepID=A0A9D4ST97_RHISA|nr:hypothetical protein HPB52_019419 [Rhipicephalus sanguineus]
MIGPRGDKCVRIKAHPSHSIIESVHQWERDGLFPTKRSEHENNGEKPQRAVAPQRTAAPRPVTRSASAAHVSARAQRHQIVKPWRGAMFVRPRVLFLITPGAIIRACASHHHP